MILFFKNNIALLAEKNQYQIRGMAILENYRNKELGKKLIFHCEQYSMNQNANLIWFDARKTLLVYIKKMAYQRTGMPFEIENIGEHVVMFKELRNQFRSQFKTS